MLYLTRLTGQSFALNPDLIERAEATPDTVVTLVNGSKYVVSETLDELVTSVRDYRAEVVRVSRSLGDTTHRSRPHSPDLRDASAHSTGSDTATVVRLRTETGGE